MIYGNTADLIAYAALRGDVIETGTATDQALQRASDYIRTRYVIRLGLESDAENVVEATYIAAGYEITTPGFWSATFTPSQTRVLTKVDKIEWTPVPSGAGGGSGLGGDAVLPISPAIEALLMAGSAGYGLPGVMVV